MKHLIPGILLMFFALGIAQCSISRAKNESNNYSRARVKAVLGKQIDSILNYERIRVKWRIEKVEVYRGKAVHILLESNLYSAIRIETDTSLNIKNITYELPDIY